MMIELCCSRRNLSEENDTGADLTGINAPLLQQTANASVKRNKFASASVCGTKYVCSVKYTILIVLYFISYSVELCDQILVAIRT